MGAHALEMLDRMFNPENLQTSDLALSTPALLFPAISLLLLAYTNRFLALASLIRDLQARYRDSHDARLKGQLDNLRQRVQLIRNMQVAGVGSLFFCTFCMLALFAGWVLLAQGVFVVSLLLMMLSLALSLRELQISVGALNLQLSDIEDQRKREQG